MTNIDGTSRRGVRRAGDTCIHGYALAPQCPRCGVHASAPVRTPIPMSRWRATTITMGPAGKIALTIFLLMPVLGCMLGLLQISTHFANVFLVVPLAMFSIIAAVVLKFTWEADRPTHP